MNNDKKHIESLLDLFMQGKTTLEQESELKRFFATAHDIPKEWEPYREMMAYFDNGMPIATESMPRRNIARPVWAVAAAAVAATGHEGAYTKCANKHFLRKIHKVLP